MTKYLYSALGLLLALPVLLHAADFNLTDSYFLKGGEATVDDVYTIGSSAVFSGRVGGDAISIGNNTRADGEIAQDALFVGERVTLLGTTSDDARLVGVSITLAGRVEDDAVLVGGSAVIEKAGSIGGNVYAAGNEVTIEGRVHGNVRAVGRIVRIGGQIEGDVEVWGDVALGSETVIEGDFIYHAKQEIQIPAGAQISGRVLFDEEGGGGIALPFGRDTLSGFFSLELLMELALGFFLLLLVRERLEETLLDAVSAFWRRVLRGVLIMLLIPIASILFLVSVVGIPVAALLLFLLAAGFAVSIPLAGFMAGLWLERVLFKRSAFPLSYRPVLLGILLLALISLIPYVGFVANLLLILASLGSIGTVFYRHAKMPV
ncbi:MAG: polymer-forming cytoskeletal protein [bacterium]|nr:polymer-forming cytoskeletal protein [bacterium]